MDSGLKEMFNDISPIQDFTGNLVLEFAGYSLGEPKYDVDNCKERDMTYSAPLRDEGSPHQPGNRGSKRAGSVYG